MHCNTQHFIIYTYIYIKNWFRNYNNYISTSYIRAVHVPPIRKNQQSVNGVTFKRQLTVCTLSMTFEAWYYIYIYMCFWLVKNVFLLFSGKFVRMLCAEWNGENLFYFDTGETVDEHIYTYSVCARRNGFFYIHTIVRLLCFMHYIMYIFYRKYIYIYMNMNLYILYI